MYSVQLTGFGKASLINYTKAGKPFWYDIIIQPIISKDMYGDEQITHLLGTIVKTSAVVVKASSASSSASSYCASVSGGTSSERSEQEGMFFLTCNRCYRLYVAVSISRRETDPPNFEQA